MRAGRVGHAAVLLDDGRVLVAGGVGALGPKGAPIASCEIFEPSTGLWHVATRLVQPRQDLALARLTDGRVLALGGRLVDRMPLATVEAWDPRVDRWERLADLPEAVYGAAVARLDDSRALVIGGFSSAGPSRIAWWLDLRTAALSPAPPPHEEHGYHAIAVTPRDEVVVSGLATEVLRGDQWLRLSRQRGGADAVAAEVLADGSLMVSGGRHIDNERARADTTIWPPGFDEPIDITFERDPRWGHTLARLHAGRIVAVGGLTDGSRFADTWEVFEPNERRWRAVPTLVESRWHHVQVALNDGSFLIAGGARLVGAGDASPSASRLAA